MVGGVMCRTLLGSNQASLVQKFQGKRVKANIAMHYKILHLDTLEPEQEK